MTAHSLSESDILRLVKEKADAFDKKIWRRDLLESIAAIVVFVVFAWMLRDPSWTVRAGALLVMGGSAYTFWRLRRARTRHAAPTMDRPVADVLQAERAKVDEQIRLLENVLWWYVAPIALGVVLVVVGNNGWSAFTVGYTAVVVLGAGVIHWLNQRTVRRCLRPRRKELTRLLDQVER